MASHGGHSQTDDPRANVSIIYAQRGLVHAHVENIFISFTSVRASAAQAQQLSQSLAQVAAQYGKLSSVAIVESAGGMPDAEARAAFERIARESVGTVVCTGLLIRGEGFGASALRALVTGMLLVRPDAYKSKVAGSCEQLAEWLSPLHEQSTGVKVEPARLVDALRQVSTHPLALRGHSDGGLE